MSSQRSSLLLCFATTVLAMSARIAGGLHHRRHVTHDTSLFPRRSIDILPRDDCEPADPQNTVTDRLNTLLNSSGPGYTLPLCPGQTYYITAPLAFAAHNQEISTVGYPEGDTRATLVVSGAVTGGTGQTTAVSGQCADCDDIKLRHIQINGSRGNDGPITGGANIEMGGDNSGQLIEFVHSFDPRGWSCLHIAEGTFQCSNQTIQNNDIGPCGTDAFQEWADGISLSCMNTVVRNNMVNNPTDGGIVIFGAPGSTIENNTIWVVNNTLLGGINMVDWAPWGGNYTDTIVRNNLIIGGLATSDEEPGDKDGSNAEDAIIKIGIAIGPRTWFGNQYYQNVSSSGTVLNNNLTGAFGYALAMSSAHNFTVQGNILVGNTSFIGQRGPNCTTGDTTPEPAAFVIDTSLVTASNEQSGFITVSDGDSLTCILPPEGGDFWPFGGNPSSPSPSPDTSSSQASSSSSSGLSGGAKAGIAIGVILGVVAIAAATFFIRRWALARARANGVEPWRRSGYLGKGSTW
ncbi:pectin lyase fold/virulence factor [Fomitopsis betulina]|nr:pectin lyase fold/virulence factor [Fomitopsis betulina]